MPSPAIETVKSFYETVFQSGDLAAADVFLAGDFVDHAPWPDQSGTREGFQTGAAQMRVAFPDLTVRPVTVFEEEDRVAVVVRISGTHHGEFMGHAATGRAFEIDGVDILRVEAGKLREHWGVMDTEQMLAQLRLSAEG